MTLLLWVKGSRLQAAHCVFKRLSKNDHYERQQIDSFRLCDGRSVEIVYLCHSGRGGGVEGAGRDKEEVGQ